MKASDNPYPSVLMVPGTTPDAPDSGTVRLFIDENDGLLKMIDDTATVTLVDLAALNPKASLVAGKIYAAATFK